MHRQETAEGRNRSDNQPPPTYSEAVSHEFNDFKDEIEAFEKRIVRRPAFMDDVFSEPEIKSIRLWVYQGKWTRVDEWIAKYREHKNRYEQWKTSVKQSRISMKHRGEIEDNPDEPSSPERIREGSPAVLDTRYVTDRSDNSVTVQFRVLGDVSGHIIGPGGSKVKALAGSCGVKINVMKEPQENRQCWTLVTIASRSKEPLITAQLRLWEMLSTANAAIVKREVDSPAVWRDMSDEERANFQSDYSVSVIEGDGYLQLTTFNEDLFTVAAAALGNEPALPRKYSEGKRSSPEPMARNLNRARSYIDVNEDLSRPSSRTVENQQHNHQNYGYINRGQDDSPEPRVSRNLNRSTNNFNINEGSPVNRTQVAQNQDNYARYRNTVQPDSPRPMVCSMSRSRSSLNVNEGGYHTRSPMIEESHATFGSETTNDKKFFMTVNGEVSEFLNSRDQNIRGALFDRFGLQIKAGPNQIKPGCTLIEFIGPNRELSSAQDFVWSHLRTQQPERIVVLNMQMCRMWRDWTPWSRTLFQNKTNVTASTTDFEGELVLRAFEGVHLHKVQNILMSYIKTGMRPEQDMDLSRKMWKFN